MLSPAEADLVRRDPGLPGLADVLDAGRFAALLGRLLPGAGPTEARVRYVKYKPAVSCLVGYQLRTAGGELLAHAKVYRSGAREKWLKAESRPSVATALGPGRVVDAASAVVVSLFPNDAHLGALGRLADETARRQLIRRLIPEQPKLRKGTLEHLTYKPERRYVTRLTRKGQPRGQTKA